jgi:glycosyltransferase involved in cell wall biosynthesis
MKYLEKLSAAKSKYVFTQDEYRINFLSDQLKIDKRKFKLIYNSGYGSPLKKNFDYFRNSFNIPNQKRIILCVGSLIKEHYIIDLLNTIEYWGENFVLVLHGWIPDKTVADFIKIKSQLYPQRLFLSENLFSAEEKETVFQSCDIGFVGFLPNNNNLKFAAGSAGKLFDFLKAGKPIIAYNTPGMVELIEANKVGFVFDNPSEISAILEKINIDYENLSQNAIKTFPKYDFMSQYESVYDNID